MRATGAPIITGKTDGAHGAGTANGRSCAHMATVCMITHRHPQQHPRQHPQQHPYQELSPFGILGRVQALMIHTCLSWPRKLMKLIVPLAPLVSLMPLMQLTSLIQLAPLLTPLQHLTISTSGVSLNVSANCVTYACSVSAMSASCVTYVRSVSAMSSVLAVIIMA